MAKGVVEGDHVQVVFLESGEGLVEGRAGAVARSLLGAALPGVIDQALAHRPSGGGEKVAAVRNVGQGVALEESEDGFVNAGARLEGVARRLAVHQPTGDAPKFRVDGADHAVRSVIAAGTDLIK